MENIYFSLLRHHHNHHHYRHDRHLHYSIDAWKMYMVGSSFVTLFDIFFFTHSNPHQYKHNTHSFVWFLRFNLPIFKKRGEFQLFYKKNGIEQNKQWFSIHRRKTYSSICWTSQHATSNSLNINHHKWCLFWVSVRYKIRGYNTFYFLALEEKKNANDWHEVRSISYSEGHRRYDILFTKYFFSSSVI